MANTKKTERAGKQNRATSTATETARSETGGGGATGGATGGTTGGGGGAGVSTQTAPLGIPSGGASVPATTAPSTGGGVNWANVPQQFPAIAWQQMQIASLMTNIALGPQHYPAGEYQAMLTQFRNICGQQVQLFLRLHLGERETVNA